MPVYLQDVVEPELFDNYITQQTAEKSAFVQSGIIEVDPAINALADKGGRTVNMPYWNDLSGTDAVPQASNSTTTYTTAVAGTTADSDVAAIHMRDKAFGAFDLAGELAGDDPMMMIADRFADFWVRMEQALVFASLDGVFADNIANDSSDLVNDISVGTGAVAANKISAEAIVDTAFLLGDSYDVFTGIGVHSVPYSNMVKQDLIEFVPDSQGRLTIPTYLGKRVIVDDGLPSASAATDGMLYTTYLFGMGAIGRGTGSRKYPVEAGREKLDAMDYIIHRRRMILHPRGFAWQDASVAGLAPTNTECQAAANWDRKYEKKNCRVVALITNG